jgi:hypothetical protein
VQEHITPLLSSKDSLVSLSNLVDLLENLRPVVREKLVLLCSTIRVEQAMERIGIEPQNRLSIPLDQSRCVARGVDDSRRLAGVLAVAVADADIRDLLVLLLCVLDDDNDIGNVKVRGLRHGASVEKDLAACLARHDRLGVRCEVLHVAETLALVGAAGRLVDEDAVDGNVWVGCAPALAPLGGIVGIGGDVGFHLGSGRGAETDGVSPVTVPTVCGVHVSHGADVGVLVQRGEALDDVLVWAAIGVDSRAVGWVHHGCEGDVGVFDGRVCEGLPEAERVRVNVQRKEDVCVGDGHGC